MAIPWAREPVPPPLPPPTYIPEISAGQDPGWQWGNDPNGADFGRPASVKPGSSLLGQGAKGLRERKEHDHIAPRRFDESRRGSSISTVTLSRDQDMSDDMTVRTDDEITSPRPASNHGYVVPSFTTSLLLDVGITQGTMAGKLGVQKGNKLG